MGLEINKVTTNNTESVSAPKNNIQLKPKFIDFSNPNITEEDLEKLKDSFEKTLTDPDDKTYMYTEAALLQHKINKTSALKYYNDVKKLPNEMKKEYSEIYQRMLSNAENNVKRAYESIAHWENVLETKYEK